MSCVSKVSSPQQHLCRLTNSLGASLWHKYQHGVKIEATSKKEEDDKPLYGIHGCNDGKVVIFGGGLPIRRKGIVIGAIGTSAGTVEQDIEVAEAAVGGIEPSIQSASVRAP